MNGFEEKSGPPLSEIILGVTAAEVDGSWPII